MKHILLFGAGKSATFLINYLNDLAKDNQYLVTVADQSLKNVQSEANDLPFIKLVQANAENNSERINLIMESDIVISLLPPALHYLVAVDCVEYGKHLLTASYIDENTRALKQQIDAKKILFLCEMGLDPGIDHMSAMQLIHKIKAAGGKITSFKSHCGGLVDPESDDNPWHYKISWNPRSVILAGKAGAIFKENGEIKHLEYENLFDNKALVSVNENMQFSYYPNRDSLSYIPIYNLENAKTFIRTTLRHPDFCFGWKNIIDLKLTDETIEYDTNNMSMAVFFKAHFDRFGFSKWLNEMLMTRLSFAKDMMTNLLQLIETENELKLEGIPANEAIMLVNEDGELNMLQTEEIKEKAAMSLAAKMHEAILILKQLFFLGLDSDELINQGKCTAATVMQFIAEKKLALQKNDKDMIVMLHEVEYDANETHKKLRSSLIVKGEDNVNTAMAKTVGLPLGIAVKLILDKTITITGLHIPTISAIYQPVLKELEKHKVVFKEAVE